MKARIFAGNVLLTNDEQCFAEDPEGLKRGVEVRSCDVCVIVTEVGADGGADRDGDEVGGVGEVIEPGARDVALVQAVWHWEGG